MELPCGVQLVAPHRWSNPAGRVDTCPPALYSPWREPGVVVRTLWDPGRRRQAAGASLCYK